MCLFQQFRQVVPSSERSQPRPTCQHIPRVPRFSLVNSQHLQWHSVMLMMQRHRPAETGRQMKPKEKAGGKDMAQWGVQIP